MIYCIIKGKGKVRIQHTYPNNRGQITTFLYYGKGSVSPRSFNLSEFESVEDFIKHEYGATSININQFNY